MKKILFLLLSMYLFSIGNAQDLPYAKQVVNRLASPEFYGRGYVNDGDKIAAEYLVEEFEKWGLQSYARGYFQKFSTSVNTFPGQVLLIINDQKLMPGKDYLIEGGSPAIKGEFDVVYLTANEILDQDLLVQKVKTAREKLLVIPPYDDQSFSKEERNQIIEVLNFLKYHPDNPTAGVIIMTDQKLTWSPIPVQFSKPTITIKIDSIIPEIEKVALDIEARMVEKHKTQNLVGFIEGKQTDSLIVFTAHYDHLGMMGSETIFPGANDNASGVAMLLNLAKYYSENQPEYTTVFMALAGEELGLLGAKHFVEHPFFDLEKIKFLINFDLVGTGEDGIQVVNGKIYQDKFDQLVQINENQQLLKEIKIRGEACNSDHCIFYNAGVPCFYIYTLGGIQAYHDVYDRAETLPMTEYEDYFRLVTAFVESL